MADLLQSSPAVAGQGLDHERGNNHNIYGIGLQETGGVKSGETNSEKAFRSGRKGYKVVETLKGML